jgi:hypothetical protein
MDRTQEIIRGCCAATLATVAHRLNELIAAERNPDVKRGLTMAKYIVTRRE